MKKSIVCLKIFEIYYIVKIDKTENIICKTAFAELERR